MISFLDDFVPVPFLFCWFFPWSSRGLPVVLWRPLSALPRLSELSSDTLGGYTPHYSFIAFTFFSNLGFFFSSRSRLMPAVDGVGNKDPLLYSRSFSAPLSPGACPAISSYFFFCLFKPGPLFFLVILSLTSHNIFPNPCVPFPPFQIGWSHPREYHSLL